MTLSRKIKGAIPWISNESRPVLGIRVILPHNAFLDTTRFLAHQRGVMFMNASSRMILAIIISPRLGQG